MRKQQLELKVDSIVRRVLDGQKVEDSEVELKSVWPDDPWAWARRIAGHANSARGESILWLVGVDEDGHKLSGVGDIEVGELLEQIASYFDFKIAPELQTMARLDYDGKLVVALLFDTTDAPYVVKRGSKPGPFDRDVPWRNGTDTRSASRLQLLELLIPRARELQFDLLHASLGFQSALVRGRKPALKFTLHIQIFLYYKGTEILVFPAHKAQVHFAENISVAKTTVKYHGGKDGLVRHYDDRIEAMGSGRASWYHEVESLLPADAPPATLLATAHLGSDVRDLELRVPLRFELESHGKGYAVKSSS